MAAGAAAYVLAAVLHVDAAMPAAGPGFDAGSLVALFYRGLGYVGDFRGAYAPLQVTPGIGLPDLVFIFVFPPHRFLG